MSEFQIGKSWHTNWYQSSLWNNSWLDLINDMLSETTCSIYYKKQGKNETSGVSYFSKILNGFCFLA